MAAPVAVIANPPVRPIRLEASPVQRYRLLRHDSGRWDVQAEIGIWHSVYSDDSPQRAFDELKRRAKLGGCVVCARCGWEVHPRLRGGQVLCEVCHTLSEPTPWLAIAAVILVVSIWLGLMFYLDRLVHLVTAFGGAR